MGLQGKDRGSGLQAAQQGFTEGRTERSSVLRRGGRALGGDTVTSGLSLPEPIKTSMYEISLIL